MAVLAGSRPLSLISKITNPRLSEDLSELTNEYWLSERFGEYPTGSVLQRNIEQPFVWAYPYNLPVALGLGDRDSALARSYKQDLYYRVHVRPSEIDAGSVVSTQIQYVEIWNAFLETKQLQTVVSEDLDGVEFVADDGREPSTVFGPTESRQWRISITPQGSPTIDGTLTWTWEGVLLISLHILGRRMFPWTLRPNWSDPVMERLEWKTNVIEKVYGSEQRRSVRIGPRMDLSFNFLAVDKDKRRIENAVYGWASRPWVVPQWQDVQLIASPALVGTEVIACNTVDRGFAIGEFATLLVDTQVYEVVEITSISPTELGVKTPLLATWPTGTKLYPSRAAWMEGSPRFSQHTDTASSGQVEFKTMNAVDGVAMVNPLDYKNLPVLEERPNEIEDPVNAYDRVRNMLVSDSGKDFIEDISDQSRMTQTHRFLLKDAAELADFRKLLYYLKGRLKTLWVPTFRQDLLLVASAVEDSAFIDVEAMNYTQLVRLGNGRKHFRMELLSGAVYYFEITAAQELDDNTERLTISPILPLALAPGDIRLMSFMMLGRLSADAVELAHHTNSIAEAKITWQSVTDPV